jgi:hypothetical protein
MLHATLTGVTRDRDRVDTVSALVWNRAMTFAPRYLVDGTGEATVVHLAGGSCEHDGNQAAALVFAIPGVDSKLNERGARLAVLRDIARAASDGRLPPEACGCVSFLPQPLRHGAVGFKLPIPRRPTDPENALTQLECDGRELADRLARFLIRESPYFSGAGLPDSAAQIGVRIGRRVTGTAVLTREDVLTCRHHDGGVARGCWPIEIWAEGAARPRLDLPPEGGYYDIPDGCLTPEGLDNVCVAGRCLSATPEALASARVLATAFSTGRAAGILAACQARGGTRKEAMQQAAADLNKA